MTGRRDKQADLKLKISPPRFAREPLSRARLSMLSPSLAGIPAILVNAPAGYGKTSLLTQWRREGLAQGTVVAWYATSPQDSPATLLQGLAMSYREAALRPTFGHTIVQNRGSGELEDFAALLGEIANVATASLLIVDDAETLPAESKQALSYILHNLPGNLRVFVGLRSLDGFDFEDLVAYGQCEVVDASSLAFKLDETFELFRQRLDGNFDADSVAQLHHVALGWPLGIQLALSAQMRNKTPLPLSHLLPEPGGKSHEHLVSLLFANLQEEDVELLVSISILDDFTAELCAEITGDPGIAARLDHISRSTPVIQLTEQSDWMRLHTLARAELQRRYDTRPEAQRKQAHEKAAIWLENHGMTYKAVRHAIAAGDADWALDLAERSLYQKMMTQGGGGSQLFGWAGVIPDAELDKRPGLLLVEAWSLALSDRHTEAGRVVARILARGEVDDALRCECDLILGGGGGLRRRSGPVRAIARSLGDGPASGQPAAAANPRQPVRVQGAPGR